MLLRSWRMWRARVKLLTPLMRQPTLQLLTELRYPELQDVPGRDRDTFENYEGMADYWDGYPSNTQPYYATFLS